MIVDKAEHREALLSMFRASTFSGADVELVHEIYQSIKNSIVKADFLHSSKRDCEGLDAARDQASNGIR